MWMPAIAGLIERRILLNYRVDADVLARLLPSPFEPQLVDGCGVAGVCLIRLRGVRPALTNLGRWKPRWLGSYYGERAQADEADVTTGGR